MQLSNDISKEELAVFLEETDEELKLIDEDLILMEKSGVTPQIIQEIFRAAHTLKGSSAMLGYQKMSNVAHSMEAVLDLLRGGKLEINTAITNALLKGLDYLKILRERLVDDNDGDEIDISEVTDELAKVVSKTSVVANSLSQKSVNTDSSSGGPTHKPQIKGQNSLEVIISLKEDCEWPAVRQFQLYEELSKMGQIVSCQPSKDEIEAGKAGVRMAANLIPGMDVEKIRSGLKSLEDVVSIEIRPENTIINFQAQVQGKTEAKAQKANIGEGNSPTVNKSVLKSETVRVDVKLLDNLMNLVGEMVIDRNRIKQISRKLEDKYEGDETVQTLGETTVHMVKLVSDLQENILRARMQDIGTILNGFPRLVRDLAQKAGKKIDFFIEGQETELDRSIIEQIRDPLLHLLRNAVDHGIESPERRLQAGKGETGTIRLSAFHEQSHIIVSISDDGGGIDAEKVKKAAVAKGYISAESAARLSQTEAQNLIFINGLSTANKVTEVSGRGVGMDVVKTNISNVGGSISVESKAGQGTAIKIRLPLTLATIDGILVSSGGLIYVVPISAIVEIIKVQIGQVQGVMGKEVIRLRNNVIPLIRLNERFSSEFTQPEQVNDINVMVIKVGDKLSGLVVDGILEPQESVVKPLGKFIGSLKGISGATIMGDGQVALILDTATLVKEY
ncbi:MAG TPA: chemotaxis protein CheA [Dehalococcoidales bacterium]|nr:chemotaxis protein CheA [Dehalococcoidales bacterium]